MANLDLIKQLNRNYGKNSSIVSETRYFALNESLDPDNIQKAITDSLGKMGSEFTQYFDLGLPADVVLLFIDVCGFSTRYSHLNGDDIGEYFDEYYDMVIPIIYKYGGEIDKIMGDGIICVFGPPFQSIGIDQNISQAILCSKEIIKVTIGTEFASKVAIHSGEINYFKNKTGLYREFTLIGKPLTELFRLESVSVDECINYYGDTDIRSYFEQKITSVRSRYVSKKSSWVHSENEIMDLKGVDYSRYFSIKLNHY
jgi:class 3 adenylate cyclase